MDRIYLANWIMPSFAENESASHFFRTFRMEKQVKKATLLASALYTEHKLVLIEELALTATLDNGDRNGINDLVGRKSLAARGALAAALYAVALLRRTGIQNA